MQNSECRIQKDDEWKTVDELVHETRYSRTFLQAMKAAGWKAHWRYCPLRRCQVATVASCRLWLRSHPDFRVTDVYGFAAERKKRQQARTL